MASIAQENYLKAIYVLTNEGVRLARAPTGLLAAKLKVTPGTVTTMCRALEREGLIEYQLRQGVALTAKGKRRALQIIRRHRLVEFFLVDTLGMNWAEVHVEAERLEHAVSDAVVDRIAQHLGSPDFDPHGDPIPSSQGRLPRRRLISLDGAQAENPHRIARIKDQDPKFLDFIQRSGLQPGETVSIANQDRAAGTTYVRLSNGDELALGDSAAAKILVEASA